MQERMERLIELSELPDYLRKVDVAHVTPGVQNICNNIFSANGIIYLYGVGVGKSTNAAALLMSYLYGYRDCATADNVGLYLSAYDLCFHNNNRMRNQPDPWLTEYMHRIKTCKCLVLDDVFATTTQQDDNLLNTVFGWRQHCKGVTVFVSGATNVFESASRLLLRIDRSAKYKEEFR